MLGGGRVWRNMASLFARKTKSLVRELGRKGELVPVDSLVSSPHLHPFCLVRKKLKRYPWPWDTPLIPTDFSLLDMLEPGFPVPEFSCSKPVHIRETEAGGIAGSVSLSSELQAQLTGHMGTMCSAALTVQTLRVSPHTWEMLMEKRRLRSPRPSFLRELQSRKARERLYVVTEAVKTLQDVTLQSRGQVGGTGQLSLLGLGQVLGQHRRATEKSVSVPQGSVLAYRVLQLVVEEDDWAVLYLSEGKLCRDTGGGMALSQDPGEEPDFQRLQDQAGAELQDLATLSPELQDALLGAFHKLLQDRPTQQELEDTLEQALDSGLLGQLDGPGDLVLSILRGPSDSVSSLRGRAILYILGALAALSDQHHCLLAESLERGILSQELELVTSILESNCKQMQEADVTLPTKALCALQSEDVALALSLVQSCGLEMQEASCRLTWDPTVVPQLFALYGCLTGLWLLAKSKPGPSRTLSKETLPCP